MAVYVLFDNVEVIDPDGLARYAEGAARTVADHGGRYLAVAAEPRVLEGEPGLRSAVLIEFPSWDDAEGWYSSPEYQPLKELRRRSVRNTAAAFAGLPPARPSAQGPPTGPGR